MRAARAARATRASTIAFTCALVLGCVHRPSEPGSLGAGQAGAPTLPPEFSLLSWNMHKQRHHRFEAELSRFAAGAELLLLQEAVEVEPVWLLLPDAHAWTLVIAWEYGRREIATGVATGSVAAPLREQALLAPVREPFTWTRKSALVTWVELAGHGGPLLLVNLHGTNFRRAAALDAQLRTIEALLETHAGPLIVAGDFNMWSRARREVVADFAARHGLASAFPGKLSRFDDVYVRGLEVVRAEVLHSRSSDHDALRVELAVP